MSEPLPSMSGPALVREKKRTHLAGTLRAEHIGQEVVLMGWVASYRDLGGAIFIDLRDRAGLAQVVFEDPSAPSHAIADRLRAEWVVGVVGKVRSRGSNANTKLPTGEIEVVASYIEVFNRAETPPFHIDDEVDTAEEKRLKYRFLDLRRPALQRNLMLRSKMNHVVRRTLSEELGFLELETPYMVKYTPGGARNFLVPSRLNPGEFYALAESPQLYKQLFMMAGFDRYFQIVKCFRDEDLRQDRQPEFTQIDLELSFADQDDVQRVMERVVGNLFREVIGVSLPERFPVMAYDEAMRRFGSDKPDLRFGLEHVVLTDLVKTHDGGGVPLFKEAVEKGGIVKAMVIPGSANLSRTEIDKLEPEAKGVGAKGLGRAKVGADGSWSQSPYSKTITDALRVAVNEAVGAKENDVILFQFGSAKLVHTVMNHLRLLLGHRLGLVDKSAWKILWVVDFPLFDYDEKSGRHVAAHHPFTSPRAEDVEFLVSEPGRVKAKAYDLVLNGNEVAGGSVRIHDAGVQAKVFEALGISDDEKRAKFGFLLDALSYGAPPHAGIAAGMDRLAMLLVGASSLREVIPYPKTQRGTDLMTGAPTPVSDAQLEELFVKSVPPVLS